MKYDLAVLIGRFQPFHNGHLGIVKSALENASNLLILVGSANIGRDTRNPFDAGERSHMISDVMNTEGLLDRVEVFALDDDPYDMSAWLSQVQKKVVAGCMLFSDTVKWDAKIALTGHERDQSSFYLKKFPQWDFLPPKQDNLHINATQIRHALYDNDMLIPRQYLHGDTIMHLDQYLKEPYFETLRAERAFELEYPKKWGKGPHQTVDNVVIQSGHVLMIERGKLPGRGKLALPGGHLELDEFLDNAAVRELFEETELFSEIGPIDDERRHLAIWQHYRARRRFDDPNRSRRARVITEAFLYKLPDAPNFSKVKGSDDAARAFWMPLSELRPIDCFEDHGFIVKKMLGYL